MKKIIISVTVLLVFLMGTSSAEELYVTDRVILGVHQIADETSVLINSLPSGSKVDTLETQGSFSKIKLDTGIEGWIKTEFLIKEQPAIIKLGLLTLELEAASKELKKLKRKAVKRERDLQTREDQVANSKSAIKELKKQLAQAQTALTASSADNATAESSSDVGTEMTAALDAANSQIKELQKQIKELQSAEKLETTELNEPTTTQLNAEIKKLLMRIKVAQANLNGEEIPSPEELAAIQPQMPLWYWVLLSIMVILGFIFGILFIDYMHRKKHGGFRL